MPGSAGLRGRDTGTRGRGDSEIKNDLPAMQSIRSHKELRVYQAAIDQTYDSILAQLVRMIEHPEQWTIRTGKTQAKNAGV